MHAYTVHTYTVLMYILFTKQRVNPGKEPCSHDTDSASLCVSLSPPLSASLSVRGNADKGLLEEEGGAGGVGGVGGGGDIRSGAAPLKYKVVAKKGVLKLPAPPV